MSVHRRIEVSGIILFIESDGEMIRVYRDVDGPDPEPLPVMPAGSVSATPAPARKYTKAKKIKASASPYKKTRGGGLSEVVEHEICSLYGSGMSTKEVANKTDVSSMTVLNVLKRNNVELRPRGRKVEEESEPANASEAIDAMRFSRVTPDKLNKIKELMKAGESNLEIADHVGMEAEQIERMRLQLGL